MCGTEVGGEPSVEADLEHDTGVGRRCPSGVDLVQAHAGGLFGEDVLAGPCRRDDELGVGRRGGSDDHGIDVVGGEQCFGRCLGTGSKRPGDSLRRAGSWIDDRDEVGLWHTPRDHRSV